MTIHSLIKAVEDLGSDIHVEVLDRVIRVRGNAYQVRGNLKLLGFQWNPKAREWYYLMQEADLAENKTDTDPPMVYDFS